MSCVWECHSRERLGQGVRTSVSPARGKRSEENVFLTRRNCSPVYWVAHTAVQVWRSEDDLGKLFSPSTTSAPGIKPRSSDLAASVFTHQTILLVQENRVLNLEDNTTLTSADKTTVLHLIKCFSLYNLFQYVTDTFNTSQNLER